MAPRVLLGFLLAHAFGAASAGSGEVNVATSCACDWLDGLCSTAYPAIPQMIECSNGCTDRYKHHATVKECEEVCAKDAEWPDICIHGCHICDAHEKNVQENSEETLPSSLATEAVPALPMSSEGDSHKCSVCGYVYDPDANDGRAFDDLPESWVCPQCGAPKSAFVAALQSSPVNDVAPTLALSSEADSHKCSVCGYVYDPDANDGQAFEDLPESWVCPQCGAPKSAFVAALQFSLVTEADRVVALNTEADSHKCSVCGFVYDPDSNDGQAFEDLPESWVCPQCGAPKSAFVAALQSSLVTEAAPVVALNTEADSHKCSVCGFVYDPDSNDGQAFEDLPESWVCPQCGAPKSAFVAALQASVVTEAAPALALSSKGDSHKCSVCGYVYDPDANDGQAFEDLPETWVCPQCGAPKSAFVAALQSSPVTESAPAIPLGSEADTYTCSVCGYVYDPDAADNDGRAFEDLPEDWVCPICGAHKSAFVNEFRSSPISV